MISIKGLHKFFNKGKENQIHVINGVDLELSERGMVAIFGRSGCGKTTLLNVIGGLDGFGEGSVHIDGLDICSNTDVIRNKYIGYIFQNYNLNVGETCFDNVADALRLCGMTDVAEIEARTSAALSAVGMEKFSKRKPDTLSGGQQQRIAIARAIVKNPRIILADEPTGNLDEANTVMIMDLLKAISKDHLVIIVTHEKNLVDYYCDSVIELSDGKVIDKRDNEEANGFFAKDKNHIYLGELPYSEQSDTNTLLEYYGDAPPEQIKIRVVNSNGRLYLKVDTPGIRVLDDSSEVKLCEGIYVERERHEVAADIDMSKLPRVEGERFGRLFSLASSIKSGFNANFRNNKRGKKTLFACMCLFAFVAVFVSSLFGGAIGDLIDADGQYNHNVFYLYTPTEEISSRINSALNKDDSGIDYIRLFSDFPRGDDSVTFRTGNFETFTQFDLEGGFSTNAVFLSESLASGMRLDCGQRELSDDEMLITTKVADALIEKSTLGYITDRSDLIGLISSFVSVGGKSVRIVGIVESDESAVYMTDFALAKITSESMFLSLTEPASDHGLKVNDGEALLAIKNRSEMQLPSLNETIKIQGKDVKITEIKEQCIDYSTWLINSGITKTDEYTYFENMVKSSNPSVSVGSDEFNTLIEKKRNEHYFEYFDYYYSEIDSFCRDLYFFESGWQMEPWLYCEKGIEIGKYMYLPEEYYKANVYKERNGVYPAYDKLEALTADVPNLYESLKELCLLYEDEFYYSDDIGGIYYSHVYLVSDADYIAFSKMTGETHSSADAGGAGYSGDVTIKFENIVTDMSYGGASYTLIHSCDPLKTEEWLKNNFSDLEPPNKYYPAILSPSAVFDSIIDENEADIKVSLVAMGALFIMMSVCMYFIMRSALMNRIKEVGIYRAIGVSKRNLIFRFFVESLVLVSLTVLVGYLASCTFLVMGFEVMPILEELLYYPLWLAIAVFAVIMSVSLFFGTLPIMLLLRKTPSQILAKYDI